MLSWKDVEWLNNVAGTLPEENSRMIIAIGEQNVLGQLNFSTDTPPGQGKSFFLFMIKPMRAPIYTLTEIQEMLREAQGAHPENTEENIHAWSPVLQDAIKEAHRRYPSDQSDDEEE